ncbi:MAG: hypothetical protein HETSPECPRED_009815 [Heterodermia speciosa]|uniref:Uncharacterized protein n=1 Tax=Heterodermia speciosa TaxID=116794 RepID=A0A8H3G057_9LECA|nr:MAG: hypothetical protein HETSPECPRED_009815 [Heterodermia speciosa]
MPSLAGAKERSLFGQVVKCYENKQYKKGLKAADQILRKHPDHGDTQAMKALIINSQGNTEEAFALAKIALKNDMKSHICWHVYGLLYRSVKNFEESIKAYRFALKLEPASSQIQRDLALLQMQMRDYPGYIQSRRAILQARSGVRQNWTALAIAQHLGGQLVDAERTLSAWEDTIKTPPPKSDVEHSEAVLYKNTIIAEMGETERALDHLDAVSKGSLDRTAAMEMRGQYLLKLGRKEEAANTYRTLLDRNSEYRAYYDGLVTALGLQRTDLEALKKIYAEYSEKNPRCDAARRVPLDFLEGDDFREAADTYLRHMLKKGAPSTFANVKSLYTDVAKRDTIQSLVESYAASANPTQVNGSAEKQPDKPDGEKPADGTDAHVEEKQVNGNVSQFDSSVRYFLVQHYNYHLSRDLEKAMNLIEDAIKSNPGSVDLYMTKARIWKHHGNAKKASETMEKARSVDERDRYINTKAAKYQLRNDENDAAIKTMSKFTRNEAVGGALGDLHDMQCVWYIIEDGESYLRQGKLGPALKRFHSISDIFEVWQEDQFDFHSFSLRKGQIRAYVDMIRWEDHLREHPFFSRAAINAAKTYVSLHDKPQLAQASLTNGINGEMDKLDKAERKKAQRKARKDQEKKEQEEAEKKDAKKTAGNVGADGEIKKEDKDPQGQKLLQTTEPLADAMKFVTPLLEYSPRNLEAQLASFEVFIRRKKFLLALRCLLTSHSLSPSNPTIHEQLLRLRHTLNSHPTSSPLPAPVSSLLETELSKLLDRDTDLTQHNDTFLATHKLSTPHVHAALRARYALASSSQLDAVKEEGQKELIKTLELGEDGCKLEDAVRGLELLRWWDVGEEGLGEYRARARESWPEATVFE